MAKRKTSRQTRKSRRKTNWSLGKIFSIGLITLAIVLGLYYAAQYYEAQSANKAQTASIDVQKYFDVTLPVNRQEQLIEYTGFFVSFNKQYHIPNYTVYELTAKEVEGNESRAKSFDRDEKVEGCPYPSDYTRSGYDRGHMTPAADMKWDYDAMHHSFLMTNICPQVHSLNSGGWKRLEEKIRDWTVRDSALVVVTGPILSANMKRIGGDVAVPERFFKAILAPYANPIRAIGFVYDNAGGQKVVERQAVSIDFIEQETGYDFFSALPDDIETEIEHSCNYKQWNN